MKSTATNCIIDHPRKVCVPLTTGLAWGNDGAIYQEKRDGRFATLQVPNPKFQAPSVIAGEQMRSGEFYAWDCLRFGGEDIRSWPAVERWRVLVSILHSQSSILLVSGGADGGALLRDVLARGGEGVVRKLPNATYYDAMTACKRIETFYCVVTGFVGGSQAVEIQRCDASAPCGRVALRGGKIEQVRIGSVIKVEGLGLTDAGAIREPRPCKDTADSWLIRF